MKSRKADQPTKSHEEDLRAWLGCFLRVGFRLHEDFSGFSGEFAFGGLLQSFSTRLAVGFAEDHSGGFLQPRIGSRVLLCNSSPDWAGEGLDDGPIFRIVIGNPQITEEEWKIREDYRMQMQAFNSRYNGHSGKLAS